MNWHRFKNYKLTLLIFTLIIIWAIPTFTLIKSPFQNDLTQFFPDQNTLKSHYLKHRLSTPQSSSWLMLAVTSGNKPNAQEDIADKSTQLKNELSNLSGVMQVLNGTEPFESPLQTKQQTSLYPYRYLLTDFNLLNLTDDISKRWQEYQLGLILDKNWLLDDPSYQWGSYLSALNSEHKLPTQQGVWGHSTLANNKKSSTALLLIEIEKKTDVLNAIEHHLNNLVGQDGYQLTGAEWIARQAEKQIKQSVNWVTSLAILMAGLALFIAFRSPKLILLSTLPLIGALAVGTLSTITLFGGMQLITLALGAILLGVAIDYPIHTIAAYQARNSTVITKIWPTIRLGALTSVFGFLMLWWVNIEGLQQIAIFSSSGLLSALLLTHSLKPVLHEHFQPTESPVQSESKVQPKNQKNFLLFALLSAIVISSSLLYKPLQWQDDIASLSPVSTSLMKADRDLRALFQQQEVGKQLLMPTLNIETLLQNQETLTPYLEVLKKTGVIQQFQLFADFLPSQNLQAQRKFSLPSQTEVEYALQVAVESTQFKPQHFSTFQSSYHKTQQLPLLTYDVFIDTHALSSQLIDQLLVNIDGKHAGVISLTGVRSDNEIEEFIKNHPEMGLIYFNQRALVSDQLMEIRGKLYQTLLLVIFVLALSIWLKYRSILATIHILTPIALAIGFTLSIFGLLEVSLSIFHLMSLMLVAAIGLDYSLLLYQGSKQKDSANEWNHSVRVAFFTTVGSFGILSLSELSLLNAIGSTVLIGIFGVYALSYLTTKLITRHERNT